MGLTRPKVGIVGGTGRMGSWFADLVERQGFEVFRTGRKTKLTPRDMARQSDVVVVSVPIADTMKVIREIAPLVRKDGLIMDLTSIKKGPVEAMVENSQAEVIGVHPLFGPENKDAASRKIALCPARGEKGLAWLTNVLEKAGMKIVIMDPDGHDRMMGLIQGVNHFSMLALALCISRSGFDFEEISDCSTQTFRAGLDRIMSIMEQPPDLFGSLLMDNPEAEKFIDRYRDSVERMAQIIRTGDRRAFGELFRSFRAFYGIP